MIPTKVSNLLKGPFNFVNGTKIAGSGQATKIFNPAKGEVIGEFTGTTKKDFESAIKISRNAQKQWARETASNRGDILQEAAKLLEQNREELAIAECIDTGKPIIEARIDIGTAIDAMKWCGGTARALLAGETQAGDGWKGESIRVPCGIVGGIGAWNYPIQVAGFKAAPSLACGNSFILRPSQYTPLTAVMLGEVLKEAGLPDGLYQVLQGEGEVGRLITDSEDISKITFTGSVPTGVAILEGSAKHIRPVTLELGGKSPLLIFDDFDIDQAVEGALQANLYSQGQVCSNASRVFVHEKIFDSFLEKLKDRVGSLSIGDPLDETTRIGALSSHEHRELVLNFIDQAKSEGGQLIYGGEKLEIPGFEKGYFMKPAIFAPCTDDLTISRKEVFGPVLQIYKFSSEEEAMKRANETELGLAAGIFTNDFSRIERFKDEIEAGTLYVNCYNLAPPELGFGGLKHSGIGKENGTEYISQFTRLKTAFWPKENNRTLEF